MTVKSYCVTKEVRPLQVPKLSEIYATHILLILRISFSLDMTLRHGVLGYTTFTET